MTEQFILQVNGKRFRCDCGCNVFHRDDNGRNYICNSCGTAYSGSTKS